jgi:nucleotide-binding universal stress UspA family protein
MKETDILCATDLSEAANTALHFAKLISERMGSRVSVLHVLDGSDGSDEQARRVLEEQIAGLGMFGAGILLPHGEPLDGIALESGKGEHGLLVLGTHGLRGIRQKLFGADILKLVRKVGIPSFVVQEESLRRSDLGPIVMPVAAHEDIHRLLEIVTSLALAFAAEVHVYQLMRPGEQPSDELLENKRMMLDHLQDAGVRVREVNEPGTGPSIGFAGPTIEYAHRIGAGCIAMMCHASKEYRYMADAEKERMLINDERIPVICA